MKKKTPVFPKEEAGNFNELSLDLKLDFSKFLEEARAHASEDPTCSAQQQQQQEHNTVEKPKMIMKETKSKKTWKESVSFFFFMFKFHEKKKSNTTPRREEEEEALPSKAKSLKGAMSNLSGPLFGNINGSRFAHLHQRMRISTSGPLISSCFTPTMAEESEVPYRYLGHPNLGAQAFGPIYLVT